MFLFMLPLMILASLANQAQCFSIFNEDQQFSLNRMLDTAISTLIAQKTQDSSLTPEHYKKFLMADETNEDIAHLSAQEIVKRSGFKCQVHAAVSDDGYISELVRIINPMADRTKLKQPPVMMMHGGITDNTMWIWSSAIQHHPEKYPRVAEDGPITSWNKSLAFTLANNGYDVWLVGTRGSNIHSKGHVKLTKHYNWFDRQELADKKLKPNFEMNFQENYRYWNYSMDDIGLFEFPRQQELILKLTGSEKVTLIDASFSTLINYGVMTQNPQYVSRLHNYVTVAPILNNRGTNVAMRTFHETICTKLSQPVGTIVAQVLLSPPVRGLLLELATSKQLRYSVVKLATRLYCGPSGQFETNLDSGILGHIWMPTGYKQLQHYCQQVIAGQPQKYDYGPIDNMRVYGFPLAPRYDLSKIKLPNWILFSAGNDKLATKSSVDQLLGSVSRQPHRHFHIERYNHLDLIAGVENDKYVNLPTLEFLDEFASKPGKQ